MSIQFAMQVMIALMMLLYAVGVCLRCAAADVVAAAAAAAAAVVVSSNHHLRGGLW